MATMVRRVVTGWDEQGKSIITSDGPTPEVHTSAMRPGFSSTELWVTTSTPARTHEVDEPTKRKRTLQPPPGGTICRIAELPPDSSYMDGMNREKAVAAYMEFGSPEAVQGNENAPHPFMHKTESVDYGIILSGEIFLVMDDTETLLKAGDVVIQRGTNHAWSNRSTEVCRIAFILIDGTWKS